MNYLTRSLSLFSFTPLSLSLSLSLAGPVVFPPSPPDAIEESSGVVVGASGFGFVPPQQSNTLRRSI